MQYTDITGGTDLQPPAGGLHSSQRFLQLALRLAPLRPQLGQPEVASLHGTGWLVPQLSTEVRALTCRLWPGWPWFHSTRGTCRSDG